MNPPRSLTARLVVLLLIAGVLPAAAQDTDPNTVVAPEMLQALDWRMVGPYRGGRSTAVTGLDRGDRSRGLAGHLLDGNNRWRHLEDR